MNVILDLCIIPIGVGVSLSPYVAACERVLAEAGLIQKLLPAGGGPARLLPVLLFGVLAGSGGGAALASRLTVRRESALRQLESFVDARARDDRSGHEEREVGRRLAVEPVEHARRYSHPRARDSGRESQDLGEPDHPRVRGIDLLEPAVPLAVDLGSRHEGRAQQQAYRNGCRRPQVVRRSPPR